MFSLNSQRFRLFVKRTSLKTDQALFINYSGKKFLILWRVLNITVFCIRIYRDQGEDGAFSKCLICFWDNNPCG